MIFLLYILVCLGAGLAVRLLRRWPRLGFAAALLGSTALCALLAATPSNIGVFLGRSLTLDLPARTFLWICTGGAGALALIAPLTFEHPSNQPSVIVANSQGTFFFTSLAPFAISIVVDSFPVAVFTWAIGLIILMLSARPQNEGRVGGAAQFLLLVVIASASLLLSNRFFDLYPLTQENLDLARNTTVFLALGMGLLLTIAPLHIWLGPLADELSPLGMAFLVAVAQPVGVWLLVQRFDVAWLAEKSPMLNVIMIGGLVTVPTGALLAISERRFPRLIAYLSLIPLGTAMIGLGLGTRLGMTGAILGVASRSAGVVLLAGGIAFVHYHIERRWMLFGTFAILAGGLTLAGVPPLLGFAANMPIYLNLGTSSIPTLILLMASSAAAVFSVARVVSSLLTNRSEFQAPAREFGFVPYLCAALLLCITVFVFLLGVFPQRLVDPFMSALNSVMYLK
jgi:formate hydrogenlyase subunit 3/multisubunit Na+/H+ antiporter MnhD subunit